MAERAPRWLVHVEWLDGSHETVIGDPSVEGDNLVVKLLADGGVDAVRFMAVYPLRHVRVWWCDFDGSDQVWYNAAPARDRTAGGGS